MEDTNPQGSATTVAGAAKTFFGMMEPEQPEGQAAEPVEEEQVEAQAEDAEPEVQEEVEEKPRYRVKIDNEELEVDLDELIQGYSRTSDYTRKTQTLAEQRKAVEAERARIDEAAKLRDTYAERLQVIEQMLTQPEEDISGLKDTDPIGYAVKMAEKVEREKQLNAVREERQKVLAQQQADQQQRLSQHLAQESERLKAAIPDLADEVKGEVVRKEIRSFAKSIGFSDQELSQVYDHRAVLTLYKAMQYDKLQKGKPAVAKKVADAPKTMKPGTATQSNPDAEATKKLMGQLRKTGKKGDAAKLFERFL